MTDDLLERARTGDGEAFRALVAPYRRELHLHCYRMLGTPQDAEDLVQETMMAAWRGLDGFAGRSSVRTWLYRIATNRCLNAVRAAARRPRTDTLFGVPPPPPTRVVDPVGLLPYPDALDGLPDAAPGPEARIERREAVSLAFLTAVQALPPRQRAVLLLRDVLGFRAAEVADLLDMTGEAVTSALKRARAALPRPATPASSQREREVAARFADAMEAGDLGAMVALLTDDAWLTMPPAPLEYQGHAAIAAFMHAVAFRGGTRRFRLVPTTANGQPAYGCYARDPGERDWTAHGLMVLTVTDRGVSAVTRFVADVMPSFGLPDTLRG